MRATARLLFGACVAWVLGSCRTTDDLFASSSPSACASALEELTVGTWQNVTPPELDLDEASFGGHNWGIMALAANTADPARVFFSTAYQGVWGSSECGGAWSKTNVGPRAVDLDSGQLVTLAADPNNPQVLYTSVAYWGGGILRSSNGGVDWRNILPKEVTAAIDPYDWQDISIIAIDPFDSEHIVASFRSAWVGSGEDGGVVEGRRDANADTWTWTLHPPAVGMGNNHHVGFANDSDTWIVVNRWDNTLNGTWRTGDGGQSFQRVSDNEHALSGAQVYRSEAGAIYATGRTGLFRSADNGVTWSNVLDGWDVGTQAVIGDGEHLYASLATPSGETLVRTLWAPETAGETGWEEFGTQLMTNSAGQFALDLDNHVLYASSGREGIYRMRTP